MIIIRIKYQQAMHYAFAKRAVKKAKKAGYFEGTRRQGIFLYLVTLW
jgi:hypothetical protein